MQNDKAASLEAKAAAADAAHMAFCLQRALDAYVTSFDLVATVQDALTEEGEHILASQQREATIARDKKATERSHASSMYVHRSRIRSEWDEANSAVDKRKLNARMASISAAQARAPPLPLDEGVLTT